MPPSEVLSAFARPEYVNVQQTHGSVPDMAQPYHKSWGASYSALHRREREDYVNGRGGRVLLFVVREGMWAERYSGGFADRMASIISMLLVCILTQTAFLLDWPGLSAAHQQGNGCIHWEYDAVDELERATLAVLPFRPAEVMAVSFPVQEQVLSRGRSRPLDALLVHMTRAGRRLTVMRGARGILQALLDGTVPGYASQLRAMGLHLNNTYSQLFAYLFAPSPAVRNAFHEERRRLAQFPLGCVLVQIRAGDAAIIHGLRNTQVTMALDRAMRCVSTLSGTGAAWYLMSDSTAIKEEAARRYGARVITRAESATHYTTGYNGSALVTLAGEMWIGSHCNGFVISRSSGLGLQAAFRCKPALDARRVRLVDFKRRKSSADADTCEEMNLEGLAREWSGI